MVDLLRKKFIKDYDNVSNNNVRAAHGKLAAIFGIISNLFLFVIKLIVGIFTLNISVFADSINNLSDMASSIIALVGFHFAKMPADKEHPFGHERIEYIAGLIISILIIISGGVLIYTSVNSIINYEAKPLDVKITIISLILLFISVMIKIYQSFFNKKIAKIISSDTLRATAQDSLNDSISTTLVFVVLFVTLLIDINNAKLTFSLDGVLGILISIYIIMSGLLLIHDEINHLIGDSNEFEELNEISEYIKNNEYVLGIHDILCHSYGPTKKYMTLHAEMNSCISLNECHNIIDEIEHYIKNKYNIDTTIHIDPVDLNNPELIKIKELLDNLISEYNDISYHDLRIINHDNNSKLEFDLSIPFELKFDEIEFKNKLNELLKNNNYNYELEIEIDRK